MTNVMGWGDGVATGDLLLAEPNRFEFLQAVRLLEAMRGSAPEPIRLRARGGFAFPASEVVALEQRTLTVSFLALHGALGPLPSALAEERVRDKVFGAFLDIFHHRLLWLLYRIRQMHSPALASDAGGHGLERALAAVAGLGSEGLQARLKIPDGALLRYAALLGRDVRSAHALERILADFLQVPVSTRQFGGRWANLEARQRTRLGGNGGHRLGQGAVLGRRAWDDHAVVEVVCGPLTADGFASLLPGGRRAAAVGALIGFYLRGQHRFALRLIVAAPAIAAGRLGQARLGYTSFLCTRPATRPAEVRVQQ